MLKIKNILIPYFIAILISLFVLLPLYKSYVIERERLRSEERRLETEERHIQDLRAAEQEILQNQQLLARIDAGLPDTPSTPSIIRHLEERAESQGLGIRSVGPFTVSDSIDRPGLRETRISLEVTHSDYRKLEEFILDLESSAKIIAIESVSVSLASRSVGEDQEEEVYNMNFSLRTYSY